MSTGTSGYFCAVLSVAGVGMGPNVRRTEWRVCAGAVFRGGVVCRESVPLRSMFLVSFVWSFELFPYHCSVPFFRKFVVCVLF